MDRTSIANANGGSAAGLVVLGLMRIAIGWHFLYEGITKFADATWSAGPYLSGSVGPLASWFRSLAEDPATLKLINTLNIWGLMLVGTCLMLGLMIRLSAVIGIGMLAMYYLAYPPFKQPLPPGAAEGHYLIVSKTLIELLALMVVVVMPAKMLGLDGIASAWWRGRPRTRPAGSPIAEAAVLTPEQFSRRRILTGLTGFPFVGAFALVVLEKYGWMSREEKHLVHGAGPSTRPADAMSSPSKTIDYTASLKDLKAPLPKAKIGDVELSRMILGGNLIGGWAHARDLIYVSKLVSAYHTREKIFGTLQLAEACGINAILTNPVLCSVIQDYWKTTGGKMKFISDCGWSLNLTPGIQKSVDNGAATCYIQGGVADELVKQGKFDAIAKALEQIRRNNMPAGIGAHHLSTVQACVERGLLPDYWMKTLHRTDYWSATPKEEHDNIWCENPDETIAFMKTLPQPWVAFKVLAAGAYEPEQAFRWAFSSGADFICVGMYDFQIVEDVNIALEALANQTNRERPWRA